jgi:hypothetical protein
VAEVLAESGNSQITFKRMGIKDKFCLEVGSQEYLRAINGLSVRALLRLFSLLSIFVNYEHIQRTACSCGKGKQDRGVKEDIE